MGLLGVLFPTLLCPLRWHLWLILPNAKAPRLDWPVSPLAVGALPALAGFQMRCSLYRLVSALALGVGLTLIGIPWLQGPFGHERMFQAA